LEIIYEETQFKTSAENKQGTDAKQIPSRQTQESFWVTHWDHGLFGVALIPLTYALKRSEYGYQVCGPKGKVSHLLYMDDRS
jgi:hypothetical protein